MTADVHPWERQPGETAKAYSAFRQYRDAGPSRSLVGARSIWRRWSYRHRWAARAQAWDTETYRMADQARLAALAPATLSRTGS